MLLVLLRYARPTQTIIGRPSFSVLLAGVDHRKHYAPGRAARTDAAAQTGRA
jgi:hypothetical protein